MFKIFRKVKNGYHDDINNKLNQPVKPQEILPKLHQYAKSGDYAAMLSTLSNLNDDEKGKLLNEKSEKEGFTPLHFAAKFGKLQIVELLLSHGASTTVRSKALNLPIHVALNSEIDAAVAKDIFILLSTKNPATLLYKGSHGDTVAHLAAEHSLIEVLERIYEMDSNVLVMKNQDHRTPLMMAISKKQDQSAHYLLNNTDITITDEWGNNAQYYADHWSTANIKEMVKMHFETLPSSEKLGAATI